MSDLPIWFYVGPDGQPIGPYDSRTLQGLLSSGYVTKDTHMWAEGRSEWQPLKEVGDLQPLLNVVAEVKKAAQRSAPKDELAAFQAEIDAIEEAAAADSGNGDEGAQTPEELEFEDDDGTMYQWDPVLRKYMPKGAAAAGAGGGPDLPYDPELMTFEGGEEVIPTLAAAKAAEARRLKGAAGGGKGGGGPGGAGQKRKAEGAPAGVEGQETDGGQEGDLTSGAGEVEGGSAAAAAAAAAAVGSKKVGQQTKKGKKGKPAEQAAPGEWFDLKNNTSIYITGLPHDVTAAEISAAFSKFGLIKEDINKQPRIKLYRDKQTGNLKGDALVSFLKEPSVGLAVQLMDGAPFRSTSKVMMTVQPAKFEKKGEAYIPKPKLTKKEKKVLAQQQERLLSWGGCDDKLLAEQSTVVIKHMFDQEELMSELGAAEELEAEVLAEAVKLGPVEKVRVFKQHPEGVVTVRFKTAEGTAACMARMHGRFFDGRQLVAEMWDGVTNYASVKVKESAEEQEARLDAYARELEARAQAERAGEAHAGSANEKGADAVVVEIKDEHEEMEGSERMEEGGL